MTIGLPERFARIATPLRQVLLAVMGLCLVSYAHAFKQGHARLLSAPGQPLEISVPVSGLSAEELSSLSVALANPKLWTESGLTPPVPVDQMRVSLKSGTGSDTRVILVQSQVASRQPVVDMLLTLTSSSGSRQVQVSLLQPAYSKVELTQSGSVRVKPGDTLFSIAQSHMVPGASIHQMLWALYQANPSAFINQNMNLVRAGAVLSVPDATTVLSIDPAYARARFAEHDARFRSTRGVRTQSGAQPPVAGKQSQSSGRVTSAQAGTSPSAPAQSRLQLSNEPVDTQSDQQAARKREIAENQERVGELSQNVQDMKQLLNQNGSGSAASSSSKPSESPVGSGSSNHASSSSEGMGSSGAVSTSSKDQASITVSRGSTTSSSDINQASATNSERNQSDKSVQDKKEGQMSSLNWLKDNLLAVLTGVLAILAFVVGWRMHRNSLRRDDDLEDPDMGSQLSPEAKAAFEKKLNAIDLNLDGSGTDTNTPANKGSNT